MNKITLTLVLTFLVNSYLFVLHMSTMRPIVKDTTISIKGELQSDEVSSLRHVKLMGSSYNIGYEFGRLFKSDLLAQETLMINKINHFIPSRFAQRVFFFFSMIWFKGIEDYIDNDSLEEMEGVSKWAPKDYNDLASPLTRQVAYHGIHEVGQMFVDDDMADMGCFASIINAPDGRIIGRNFDFDIDGHFDEHKVIKWVYPDIGLAYVSIIFPGMVGAVTGINERGIYASINSAGTEHWARIGTPTTIITKRILQSARTIEEAIEVLKTSKTFISEIFLIADINKNKVYRVEKSPEDYSITEIIDDDVISNHMVDSKWENDKINLKRQRDLTTAFRYKRGRELLKYSDLTPLKRSLSIQRDKNGPDGKFLHFGHRGSIDSLIASHSTLLDFKTQTLYVNEKTGTSGRYIGYNIKESFQSKIPIVASIIDESKDLTPKEYLRLRKYLILNKLKLKEILDGKCREVDSYIEEILKDNIIHYDKDILLGNYYDHCKNNLEKAKTFWEMALKRVIPFFQKADKLRAKINE